MKHQVQILPCLFKVLLTGYYVSAYDNLALGKSASQEYPFFPDDEFSWGADKAVDGLFANRSAGGGQCTISDSKKLNATWWVDLGGVFRIHHITIYYRTDNFEWNSTNPYTGRFLGFSVYVSNTTNKDEGILCFKDIHYDNDTIPSVTTIECVKYGRYVIYYNERIPGVIYPEGYSKYAYNELCELEVYGCNIPNVYGENCMLPCPQNCHERFCNIVDGTCLGCVTGYKGPRCEEQCDGWFYGTHCNQSCGWCLNFDQCHHIDGTCFEGCEIGFQGDKCTEECPIGRYGYNCQDKCNIKCGVPGRCNRVTGQCQRGCQEGWKGIRCDKRCVLEMSGYNCNKTCNTDCFNGTCDITADACLLLGAPDPQGINIAYIIGGASAAIFVTVTVVIFVIVIKRIRVRKVHNGHQNISTQVFIDNVTATIEIYNKTEDNCGYQELKEIESETVICNKCEDNAEYQEIGEISQHFHDALKH